MARTHIVESTPETVRSGYLDPAANPVAVIEPGDTVRYPNTWTHWGNEAKFWMSFADREPLRHQYPHGPYSMLGPVEVRSERTDQGRQTGRRQPTATVRG